MWTLTAPSLRWLTLKSSCSTIPCQSSRKEGGCSYISRHSLSWGKDEKFCRSPSATTNPRRTSSDSTTVASPLQWTGSAIDLVELIYGINLRWAASTTATCRSNSPTSLQDFRGLNQRDYYRFYIDIKAAGRTTHYFLNRIPGRN